MKRVAVSVTQSEKEISPTMDLCEYFLLVDYKNGKLQSQIKVRNPYKEEKSIEKIASFIKEQKTNTLITGKIQLSTIELLEKNNIKVINNLFGETNAIVKQFISNN